MISWGPDSFAAVGGLFLAMAALVFLALEYRHWRRRREAERKHGPEQQFRTIIENFNRLDQSVTADSISSMPSSGGSDRR